MKLKSVLAVAIGLTFATALFAQETQVQAPSSDEIMNKAYTQAKAEGKKVILMFHASWCGWCHRMDSLMTREDTRELFDRNFVTTHLVVDESPKLKHLENPGANEIRSKYKGDKVGIPFWLVFDMDGNLLADAYIRPDGALIGAPGQNTGCPATAEEVAYWMKVLKATTNLNEEELSLIASLFKR